MNARDIVATETRDALLNRKVATAELGYGSILLLYFEPAKDAKRGAYLRVECAWSLQRTDEVLAASEDDRAVLKHEVERLRGSTIRAVEISLPGLQLTVQLDDVELKVFPVYATSEEYENWTVHTPDGRALIAGPGRWASVKSVDDLF